jgi:hypothetical protein
MAGCKFETKACWIDLNSPDKVEVDIKIEGAGTARPKPYWKPEVTAPYSVSSLLAAE